MSIRVKWDGGESHRVTFSRGVNNKTKYSIVHATAAKTFASGLSEVRVIPGSGYLERKRKCDFEDEW